ncbi:MAG: hypothetical protein JXA23_12545, partial [Bacteroidales bacterium]|nr:hypothetical protein [Bacteroidales bacterium]
MNLIQTPLITMLLIASGALAAQNADSVKVNSRVFQISFVTPLGTNGLSSWTTTNNFSINILTGYAGGVNGTEFTGLVSVLNHNLRGAQFAGLGHVVGG